jgi:hypothetical protein
LEVGPRTRKEEKHHDVFALKKESKFCCGSRGIGIQSVNGRRIFDLLHVAVFLREFLFSRLSGRDWGLHLCCMSLALREFIFPAVTLVLSGERVLRKTRGELEGSSEF